MDMTEEYIKKEIEEYIVETTLAERDSFHEQTLLFEEGIFDSMGLLMLIDFIQEKFQVQTSDEELTIENFESVNSIVSFVRSKVLSVVH